MQIGEAAHARPRAQRREPRSLDSRLARRSRGWPARKFLESIAVSCEKSVKMLFLSLGIYLPHIAETIALLRGTKNIPCLIPLERNILE